MNIQPNFPLSEITYYKIGGVAEFLLEIENEEDISRAFEFIQTNNIKNVLCLGLGANILINESFNGAVLWFCKAESKSILMQKYGLVKVFAGVILDDLIQYSFSNNLVGLEWAGGLPSTVGAAARGNVGAFGGEIKDTIQSVEFFEITPNGSAMQNEKKEYRNADCNFSYRNSIFKNNKNIIITSVTFKLKEASTQEIEKAKEEYLSHIDYRNTHHPMTYPSCGSVFKNIVSKDQVGIILNKWSDVKDLVEQKWHGKVSMGYIIKKLGLSGFQIGGAQVSETHTNYIINKEHARFSDVVQIIEKIKETFFKEFGFYPEPEVEIIE